LDDIGYCENIQWSSTGVLHYTCGLIDTNNDVTTGGDSGAPWFDDTPGRAVGIHTAGTSSRSIFTNIGRVSSNLDATVRQN
jgi:hypothetical protein